MSIDFRRGQVLVTHQSLCNHLAVAVGGVCGKGMPELIARKVPRESGPLTGCFDHALQPANR